jgi:hypothetical protein
MKYGFRKILLLLLVPVLPGVAAAAEPAEGAAARYVAALKREHRPSGAPAITEFVPGAEWRRRSLTGISSPVPASLAFLDHQGAWYTPFISPGMPGAYDLRVWHRAGRVSIPTVQTRHE